MKQKVKSPIGYHFMVKNDNDFYLMRTSGKYSEHTAGEYTSQLSIDIEVKDSHLGGSFATTGAVATTTSTTPRATRTVTRTATRSTAAPRTTTRTTSTGY